MAIEAIIRYGIEEGWNQTIRKHLSDQLEQLNPPEDIEGFPSLEDALDQVREIDIAPIILPFLFRFC